MSEDQTQKVVRYKAWTQRGIEEKLQKDIAALGQQGWKVQSQSWVNTGRITRDGTLVVVYERKGQS